MLEADFLIGSSTGIGLDWFLSLGAKITSVSLHKITQSASGSASPEILF